MRGTELATPLPRIISHFPDFVKEVSNMNVVLEAVLFAVIFTVLREFVRKIFDI